jgi:hypothetical protein
MLLRPLLLFLCVRAATAHPAALHCTSDATSKLRVPVPPDNSTMMMGVVPVKVTPAQAKAVGVSMSVDTASKTLSVVVPDGVFFVARADRGGSLTPAAGNNRTVNTDKCAGQVITPSKPTPAAGAYHFDLKVFAKAGSHIVLGFAKAHGKVSLLQSPLIPQNAKPEPPSPAPAPVPATPSAAAPSPAAPSKHVGHAKNISLGPDMRMDFSAVGDDSIEITVRMPGKHAWIGFGLSADGTMVKSELTCAMWPVAVG